MKKNIILLFILCFLLAPPLALAKIGVGVGTGKIQVNEPLRPGGMYDLPVLSVLNTGDESSYYDVSIAYHEDQPEMRPASDWFIFEPRRFYLEPGEAQSVSIKLNLPVEVVPGDYFAFLEGRPVKEVESGNTTIGVAAAAKLYFTIQPANLLQGIYYKIAAFVDLYSPWPQVVLTIIILALIFNFLKKRFNFKIKVDKK